MKRRILCLLLSFISLISLLPSSCVQAANAQTPESLIRAASEKLVMDYAAAHSRSGSSDGAVEDFLRRSISGKGKDWALSPSSNTVATIFGSKVFQESMINVLTETLILMESQGEEVFHTYGKTGWHNYYHMYSYLGFRNDFQDYERFAGTVTDTELIYGSPAYVGPTNRNDDALEIIAGDLFIGYTFRRGEVNEAGTSYTIDLHLFDNFDFDGDYSHISDEGFDTSVDSALKGIGKLLAVMLITEFHWYFKESFTITIPNSCTHEAEDVSFSGSGEKYHSLEKPVILSHDNPWVLEYISDGSSPVVFSSTKYIDSVYPLLMELNGSIWAHYYELVWLTQEETAASGVPDAHTFRYHHFGHSLESTGPRRVRLENIPSPNGGNMIYVSVYDLDGNLLSPPTPMDSHCTRMKNETQMKAAEEQSTGVSGLDFVINYIGNESYPLPAGLSGVRILSYGEGAESLSTMESCIVEPGCTHGGYTATVCRLCGYSSTDNATEALGHDFGEYISDDNEGCTTEGSMSAACKRCGEKRLSDEKTPPLGHSWDQGTVIKAPSISEEGTLCFTCNRCGEKRTEAIAVLPSGLFLDVPSGSWFEEPVYWAVAKGITKGISENMFGPSQFCTRAQVVTFLWRAAGQPEPGTGENPFEDINEDSYFCKAVLWAVEKGITTGTDESHFSPASVCTRAQVAAFMYRAAGSPEIQFDNSFADVPDGTWYSSAVSWAFDRGITTGTADGLFSPASECTRAQIVSFIYRMYTA